MWGTKETKKRKLASCKQAPYKRSVSGHIYAGLAGLLVCWSANDVFVRTQKRNQKWKAKIKQVEERKSGGRDNKNIGEAKRWNWVVNWAGWARSPGSLHLTFYHKAMVRTIEPPGEVNTLLPQPQISPYCQNGQLGTWPTRISFYGRCSWYNILSNQHALSANMSGFSTNQTTFIANQTLSSLKSRGTSAKWRGLWYYDAVQQVELAYGIQSMCWLT